jgi:hypothetical protein
MGVEKRRTQVQHEYAWAYVYVAILANASPLTPKGLRVFQWKNGQNYPLLKNTHVIIFSTTFYCF